MRNTAICSRRKLLTILLLKEAYPGKAFATLQRLGQNPATSEEDNEFTLGSHAEENFSVEEQLERISSYFVSIADEFTELKVEDLPDDIKRSISNINVEEIPKVESLEMYKILKSMKNKKSSVPGDLPPRIFNNDDTKFALSEPAAKIMNNIATTGEWPTQYKTEWGVVLKKEKYPEVEKHLRIISCTNQLSRAFEKVMIKWLMKYVKPYLDIDQMGGQKGQSIAHYLIEMVNFILYNQDLKNPHATIAAFIDYAQGFNRVKH